MFLEVPVSSDVSSECPPFLCTSDVMAELDGYGGEPEEDDGQD